MPGEDHDQRARFRFGLEQLMNLILEIGIFAASVMVGLILGGRVPAGMLPQSWRLPVAAFLVGMGMALAVIGLS